MKHPGTSGMNKTGVDMSPMDMKELLQGAGSEMPSSAGDEQALAAYRRRDLEEAEPIGTVPIPGSMKGAAKTGFGQSDMAVRFRRAFAEEEQHLAVI
ncbi:MAG TPA: hypothetical protein VFQ34_02785, partial [Nitrospiraceae bacterium]|nr:hypothetical protein [Nitrospiraceae bacterium]